VSGLGCTTGSGGELAKNLSGGMKRRLNMAAGIIHRPRVVLMDEPTVGVDPQSRIRIFEMIEALRAAGTAIVYTTHYVEEAERLCDRISCRLGRPEDRQPDALPILRELQPEEGLLRDGVAHHHRRLPLAVFRAGCCGAGTAAVTKRIIRCPSCCED
jgi:ABC-type nitrate/sulfonate/bicarbonate transport system ATPase subunit